MFGKMVSDLMIKPGNAPVFDSPDNYNLEFEDVAFDAADGVTLRGWLVKGDPRKVVIQSHFGVQCSRSGYCPSAQGMIKMWKENIHFLRQVKALNDAGYTVLMYDMRNHGESDLGTVPWVSWGPEEAKDAVAAVRFITSHPVYSAAEIGLLAICMGSAAATYAFGQEGGLATIPAIKAMIAVQPLHYKAFTKAFGLPGFLVRAGDRVSLERTGLHLSQRTFMDDVQHINVPTMVVQNQNDPWTDLDFVQSYIDALRVPVEHVKLDLSKDRAAAYDHLGTHPGFLVSFFDKHIHPHSTVNA